jgi:hypothetical protein
MRQWISKSILVVEVLVLLLPMTYLIALYMIMLGAVYWSELFNDLPAEAHSTPALILISAVTLAFGWYVCLGFLICGRPWLAKLGRVAVVILYCGAILATFGTISYFIDISSLHVDWIKAVLRETSILIFGVPALAPFVHLEIERCFAKARAGSERMKAD